MQVEKIRAASIAYKKGLVNLAFDLYKSLADEGHVESQIFVAWMFYRGIGCVKNDVEAEKYYQRAASLGSPIGCFYFGRWLSRAGKHSQAYDLYQKSAQDGYLPSVFRIGHSLAYGKGVPVNKNSAYRVLKFGASRGHVYALREISIQDLKGGRGVAWMPLGLIEFLVAFFWGIVVFTFNKNSDLLKG